MGGYKLSPGAESDLYRIWTYGVERWGVEAADRYYEALFERFEDIAASPKKYPNVDDIRPGYRRSVCGRDSIYYQIAEATVEIMAVIGRQDLERWL